LRLASGVNVPYSKLVLATGGMQRHLPLEGADLEGVFSLRTLAEARLLRDRLEAAENVVIIGAGFIGLEFAAVAAAKGLNVNVLELAARPMARVVTPQTSAFFAKAHEAFGVTLNFGTSVVAIKGEGGNVSQVVLTDGRVLPADLVLVGIGLVPSVELLKSVGLECSNGVEVDAQLATSAADIYAIGDIALHPNAYAARPFRLESVQNATDQARTLAKHLSGKPAHYDSVPWFWSDQGDLKLQMVGFLEASDKIVLRGSYEERAYSLFGFKGGELIGVESVNKAGDHMLARRLIGEKIAISPEIVADPSADLKALLKPRR
jgi:3-phenylpropionate/trans-cinnamate dioxygenase ferredoxin reductase subunit